jgi:hypothetical protein
MVTPQIWEHLQHFEFLVVGQSEYRPGHSSETVILHVLSNSLPWLRSTEVTALFALLDISTAFNTVDHDILQQRLRQSFEF